MHWGMGTSPHGNGHTRRSEFNGPSHGSVKVFNKVRKEEERDRERERRSVLFVYSSMTSTVLDVTRRRAVRVTERAVVLTLSLYTIL